MEEFMQRKKELLSLKLDKAYSFDWVFDNSESSESICNKILQDPIKKFVSGQNVSFLLNGLTGSGKTHMAVGNVKDPGLMLLLIRDSLFAAEDLQEKGKDVTLSMSICRYKDGKFYDAIADHNVPLEIYEDSRNQINLLGGVLGTLQQFEKEETKGTALKNSNLILQLRCTCKESDSISLSYLKLIKMSNDQEINSNFYFLLHSLIEVNDKPRKIGSIPYNCAPFYEYIRDSLGGNCITYLLSGYQQAFSQEQYQEVENAIRALVEARRVGSNPSINSYCSWKQIEFIRRQIHDLIVHLSNWPVEFQGEPSKSQQTRITILFGAIGKAEAYLKELMLRLFEKQEIEDQMKKQFDSLETVILKAYTKCLTTSGLQEFYIGKMQKYNIDTAHLLSEAPIQSLQNLIPQLNRAHVKKLKQKMQLIITSITEQLKIDDLVKRGDLTLVPPGEGEKMQFEVKDFERIGALSHFMRQMSELFYETSVTSQFKSADAFPIVEPLMKYLSELKQALNSQIIIKQKRDSLNYFPQATSILAIESKQHLPSQQSQGSQHKDSVKEIVFGREIASDNTLQKQKIYSGENLNTAQAIVSLSAIPPIHKKIKGKESALSLPSEREQEEEEDSDYGEDYDIDEKDDESEESPQNQEKELDLKALDNKYLQHPRKKRGISEDGEHLVKHVFINNIKVEVKMKNSMQKRNRTTIIKLNENDCSIQVSDNTNDHQIEEKLFNSFLDSTKSKPKKFSQLTKDNLKKPNSNSNHHNNNNNHNNNIKTSQNLSTEQDRKENNLSQDMNNISNHNHNLSTSNDRQTELLNQMKMNQGLMMIQPNEELIEDIFIKRQKHDTKQRLTNEINKLSSKIQFESSSNNENQTQIKQFLSQKQRLSMPSLDKEIKVPYFLVPSQSQQRNKAQLLTSLHAIKSMEIQPLCTPSYFLQTKLKSNPFSKNSQKTQSVVFDLTLTESKQHHHPSKSRIKLNDQTFSQNEQHKSVSAQTEKASDNTKIFSFQEIHSSKGSAQTAQTNKNSKNQQRQLSGNPQIESPGVSSSMIQDKEKKQNKSSVSNKFLFSPQNEMQESPNKSRIPSEILRRLEKMKKKQLSSKFNKDKNQEQQFRLSDSLSFKLPSIQESMRRTKFNKFFID